MSENIFKKSDQEHDARMTKWGLQDLDSTAQMTISLKAKQCIYDEKITDETEKLQVYKDVKQQYLEYAEEKSKEHEERRKREDRERQEKMAKEFPRMYQVLKNDRVLRLELQVNALDERLAKLERYTQE